MDELNCDHKASKEAEMNASRHKIQLQETVETEEIDEEKWTKFKGRSKKVMRFHVAVVKEM